MKIQAIHIAVASCLAFLVFSVDAKTYRSPAERHAFVKLNPCPMTGKARLPCPGWQIDHIIPLKCGGLDSPANMQWLTIDDHKTKTRREAKWCRRAGHTWAFRANQ